MAISVGYRDMAADRIFIAMGSAEGRVGEAREPPILPGVIGGAPLTSPPTRGFEGRYETGSLPPELYWGADRW